MTHMTLLENGNSFWEKPLLNQGQHDCWNANLILRPELSTCTASSRVGSRTKAGQAPSVSSGGVSY